MSNILEAKNLAKNYETFSLRDVSFEIPRGYIMGFIGPNGAGKTTTIKSILNMISPNSGTVKLFGDATPDNPIHVNEQIGVVMDSPFFVDDWTIADIEAAVSPFYSSWDKTKYTQMLTKFGIDKKKKVKELSRGMKVKLMLAVALSHDAKLLILDEPTSGLDPVARDELCTILGDFVADESCSVLFSTHITADLEKIADYVTFIMNGRIIFTGLKDALLEKYVRVKGGINDITDEQRKHIIGYREHPTGFDGLTEASDTGNMPDGLLIEPATLEEIIIYINRDGEYDE